MRRWLTRILVCLLLGGVTTVGVAWGLWDRQRWENFAIAYMPIPEDSGRWQWHSLPLHDPGSLFVQSFTNRASSRYAGEIELPRWSIAHEPARSVSAAHPVGFNERAYGWPMLCCFQREQYFGSMTNAASARQWRPILPGFAIDTLFYGVIWFALIFGIAGLKRTLRTRRGRCPKCAYDLRGDLETGCPECGWGREDEA